MIVDQPGKRTIAEQPNEAASYADSNPNKWNVMVIRAGLEPATR